MIENIIRIKSAIVNAAAIADGITAVEFVSRIRSISLGREVCAHFKGVEGDFSVFVCE